MITLFEYSLDYYSILFLSITGILIGMSKVGVKGTSMLAVPFLTIVFGGKQASGIILPALILADIVGVSYYNRHAQFSYLWKLLPWAILGVLLGTYYGNEIDDELFKNIMSIIIIISLIVMIIIEKMGKEFIPNNLGFAAVMGIIAGFTTMVGNLAGTAMAIYLLAMRMPKNEFIGTAAWFFIIINVFKVPFHIWVWNTISWNSFLLDLSMIPMIGIGAWLGILLVKRIPEQHYRWFIIGMTAVSAIAILLR